MVVVGLCADTQTELPNIQTNKKMRIKSVFFIQSKFLEKEMSCCQLRHNINVFFDKTIMW
jgi:hypothetical protein